MPLKPVVALDIDGTLADYHDHFITFAEAWVGKEMRRKYDGSVSLAKWCGIGKATYRECKLAFRQGGLKRSMPVYDGARDLTVSLRRAGAEVVICTTRPYLHLSNIEPDTLHWLRRNRIQHDDVLFGQYKYNDLIRNYGKDRIIMVLDDLPEQISAAFSLGLPAVIRRNHHNSTFEWKAEVHSLDGARQVGLYCISTWRAEQ